MRKKVYSICHNVLMLQDVEHPALRNRRNAAKNLKEQADRMVTRGKGLLPPLKEGDNALLRIPEFDQGRGDARNLIVVILKEEDGKFEVGTKHGRVDRRLERNALDATKCTSVAVSDVPEAEFTIRELVRLDSVGTGQGYRRCNCRQKCVSKRCACVKSGLQCNSACHAGRTCDNNKSTA